MMTEFSFLGELSLWGCKSNQSLMGGNICKTCKTTK